MSGFGLVEYVSKGKVEDFRRGISRGVKLAGRQGHSPVGPIGSGRAGRKTYTVHGARFAERAGIHTGVAAAHAPILLVGAGGGAAAEHHVMKKALLESANRVANSVADISEHAAKVTGSGTRIAGHGEDAVDQFKGHVHRAGQNLEDATKKVKRLVPTRTQAVLGGTALVATPLATVAGAGYIGSRAGQRKPVKKGANVISAFGVDHGPVSKALTGTRGDKRNTKYVGAALGGSTVGSVAGQVIGAKKAGTTMRATHRAGLDASIKNVMEGGGFAEGMKAQNTIKGAKQMRRFGAAGSAIGTTGAVGAYAVHRHRKGNR